MLGRVDRYQCLNQCEFFGVTGNRRSKGHRNHSYRNTSSPQGVITIITLIAMTGSCCMFLLIICYNFYDTNSSFNLIHLPH